MKITVFQSDKGDCLLLTGADGKRVLVDGGMRASYTKHVAPALDKLRKDEEALDVVCVSHIDQDHISGVLQMMDDEVEWRVHDFQVKGGNKNKKAPAVKRPPKVKDIWHNAFHEQVEDNDGAIENMLAASSAILSGSELGVVRELAAAQSDLATSIAEAIQLSRRVSPEQLGIKLNRPAKGALMLVREKSKAAISVGGMKFRIIGPFERDLEELRKEWNTWLEQNQKRIKSIQNKAAKDASAFSAPEISDLLVPKLQQAEELSSLLPLAEEAELAAAFKLGVRKKVTTPNLASLMFYVEEGGKTLLLTGDGHHEDILKGLAHLKKLDASGSIHVDVLKVQHHGSEHNLNEEFCRKVTARDYVFCGNGEHANPDLRVVRAIADSRIGSDPAKLSQNPAAAGKFKFWFNSSDAATEKPEAKEHMREIKKLVDELAAQSGGRLSSFFLKKSSFDINL
jgi:Metallo-beta-lactamase superfamily